MSKKQVKLKFEIFMDKWSKDGPNSIQTSTIFNEKPK